MRSSAKWLVGAALAALATTALGQLAPTGLTGNEVWSCAVGGPGGTSTFCTVNLLRNTQSYQLTNTATGAVQAPANTVGLIFTAALSGAITLTAPTTPYDGQKFAVSNGTTAAFTQTITFTAATGQTVVNGAAAANLAVGATAAWIYVASSTSWYRIQ